MNKDMQLQIFHKTEAADRPMAVALGSFDGIHRGHMDVLRQALACKKEGYCPAAFTLEGLIGTAKPVRRLLSRERQAEILNMMGFERLYRVDFESVRQMSPEDFVRQILHEQLGARVVCCGFNYHFGYKGAGDTAALQALCEAYGIQVRIAPPCMEDGEAVSSSRIRKLVEMGDMQTARKLLGRPYAIDFQVVHGRALGRTIGLPTINQPFPGDFALPRFGVYASSVRIDGKQYHAVTNVGIKPTVGSDGPLAETCIFGFSGNLYGRKVPVELLAFLRPEQRFSSVEHLRRQIIRDGQEAEKILLTL